MVLKWSCLLLALGVWLIPLADRQGQALAQATAQVTNSPPHVLKIATLAPQGTTWARLIEEWGRAVEKESGGRIRFKYYPGGVAGDEADVVRKIRFGQLQAGAVSGYGVGHMYPPARVLEIPFLFRDEAEVDHVRAALQADMEQGFRAAGWELLGWMEVGKVHLLSREPVRTLEDMRARRVWMWSGDAMQEAFFDASGIAPVPLSITDVYTGLSTGLLDTVFCPPIACIAFQWYRKGEYLSSEHFTIGAGAIVVSGKFFAQLPEDLRAILKRTGREAGERIVRATRADNVKSLEVLKGQGIRFQAVDGVAEGEFIAIRDRAARTLMKSDYVPESLFARVRMLLDRYRSGGIRPSAAAGKT